MITDAKFVLTMVVIVMFEYAIESNKSQLLGFFSEGQTYREHTKYILC